MHRRRFDTCGVDPGLREASTKVLPTSSGVAIDSVDLAGTAMAALPLVDGSTLAATGEPGTLAGEALGVVGAMLVAGLAFKESAVAVGVTRWAGLALLSAMTWFIQACCR